MKTSPRQRLAVLFLASSLAVSCSGAGRGPVVVRPGAPGDTSRVEEVARSSAQQPHTAADVHFMHGMIAHHAQALEMTALVATRSARDDIRLLSRRIDSSQTAEIARMQRWLGARREPVSTTEHMHMPGMLSTDELARLAAATGAEFDRLFLELMIRHHEGALTMVAELFATEGAGQDLELFQFASDVDADQRGEIARMRRMQTPPPQRGPQ